jgi:hypothetical protein
LVGERDIARFAALGTVVQSIDAEPDVALAFADRAVLFAGAVFFGLFALRTNHLLTLGCHFASEKDFT